MILDSSFHVREVNLNDEAVLLSIRNQPENYKWFFDESEITPENHSKWFSTRMQDLKFFTLVAVVSGQVIGVVYLDSIQTNPKVSINIKPGFKGIGVGTALLKELILRAKSVKIESICAEIKDTNADSLHFFLKNSFVRENLSLVDLGKSQRGTLVFSLSLRG
jgi:L-amino acid N-acyltransferase YncA